MCAGDRLRLHEKASTLRRCFRTFALRNTRANEDEDVHEQAASKKY